MKRILLLVLLSLGMGIRTIYASEGALGGEFSVSATKKVHFSRGNLQYNSSVSSKWRFAEHQYDYIGAQNGYMNWYSGYWFDLFGYGTSGWNSGYIFYSPISTSTTESKYIDKDLTGAYANADWGVYNAISNGGNQAGLWRTLTGAEWTYLLQERPNAANLYSSGSVNSIDGVILLPDNWVLPSGVSFTPKASSYAGNTYTTSQWDKMEKAGAVFLPAAGWREERQVHSTWTDGSGLRGCYHSSTVYTYGSSIFNHFVSFYSNRAPAVYGNTRCSGLSVRLVQDVPQYSITTSATNGTVIGGGTYDAGTVIQLSATPAECYEFVQWSDGNIDNPRTITVTEDATYTAEFEQKQYTITFMNHDGTILQSSSVICGSMPEYTGDAPTRASSTQYQYTFAGWSPEVATAVGNAVYTAQYQGTAIGALVGEFSISATQKVHFAQGNLQYQASTKTWRFAPRQCTRAGVNSNTSVSSSYSGWIDLFSWGSSGYKLQPYANVGRVTSWTPWYVNGERKKNIAGTNYDWGIYNKISNGGNTAGRWRTLTSSEWKYLISQRTNAAQKMSCGKVDEVKGVILLPDDWTLPESCTFNPSQTSWTANIYTAEKWLLMEAAGAVFLPACGYRYSDSNDDNKIKVSGDSGYATSYGEYWCSTHSEPSTLSSNASPTADIVHFMYPSQNHTAVIGVENWDNQNYRFHGRSVRMVLNGNIYNPTETYTITTSATNGTVLGEGSYNAGQNAILTATPDECYEFVQWSDGNTDNPRTVVVTGNATYTAEFGEARYTVKGKDSTGGKVVVEK